MKCERCNSTNVRRSSWKRNEHDKSHVVYAPYRCRDCEHRFFRVSRTFKGTLLGAASVVGFLVFVVSIYVISQPPELPPALAGEGEFDPGRKALFQRAEKGKAEDQFTVGLMLLRGDGIAQNYGEAIKWFERAAQKNHAAAQLNLGLLYKNGRGVLQDFTTASQWFEKAAHQGHPEAEYHLGTLYKVGEGVKHDMKQAYAWYNLAASHGYEPALTARQTITNFMSAAEVAEAQAISRQLISPAAKKLDEKPPK